MSASDHELGVHASTPWGVHLRLFLGGVLVAALLVAPASAQRVRRDLPVPDGAVEALVADDGVLYVGGLFSHFTQPTGGIALLDATSGAVDHTFPTVEGTVLAVAADGTGGWFVGGSFFAVGGVRRINLAHVHADHSVDPWDPQPDGPVTALAVSGGSLYVAGTFTHLLGAARTRLARIDIATGLPTTWAPSPNDQVFALAVSGNTVYVGGLFTSIGGQSRSRIAALDATTGAATGWNPNASGAVRALIAGAGVVYVGGEFTVVGGQFRNLVAAVDSATGGATAWNPGVTGNAVRTLALEGDQLYIGGYFSFVNGASHPGLARVSASTGALDPWYVAVGDPVDGLALTASHVVAVGEFPYAPGTYIAWVDRSTGVPAVTPAMLDDAGLAAAAASGAVLVGGYFTTADVGTARSGLAAIDLSSGQLLPFAPVLSPASVSSLALRGDTLYVGGEFTSAGGQARYHFAAVHATTGAVTAWDPQAAIYPSPARVALHGGTVFLGGDLVSLGGQSRRYLGEVDAVTGAVTAWDAHANGMSNDLLVSGDTLYVCGGFDSIGGWSRVHIAALSTSTGIATDFEVPGVGSALLGHLALRGDRLYVAGSFTELGGLSRSGLAAVDRASGAVLSWTPAGTRPTVFALATDAGSVYAGGPAPYGGTVAALQALDPVDGADRHWDLWPLISTSDYARVDAIAGWSGAVAVGGLFNYILGAPQSNLAVITDATTAVDVALVSADVVDGRARLVWQLADATGPIAVQRRTPDTPWAEVGRVALDGLERARFEDAEVVAGQRYGYRLAVDDAGVTRTLGEVWLDVPATLALALAGPRPNPATGALRVVLTLPDASPARLEVFDLAGRRVAGRDVGALGAGVHQIDAAGGTHLAPGVYLVRLTRGGDVLHCRTVFVR